MDSRDYAFCAWNPEGETLHEAVPELEKIISIKKTWRAVVIADSRTGILDHNRTNPFNYAAYRSLNKKMEGKEQIREYRDYVRESVEKALSNPLMKLSVWLAGSAVRLRPSAPEISFLDVEPDSAEYHKVREEYECSVADFELTLARAYRFDMINENFELSGEFFNPPKAVIAIAERSLDVTLLRAENAWKKRTEYDYSNFIEDNMYSSKTRCLIYDIPRVRGEVKQSDYFQFLSAVMIIALNDIDSDVLKFGRIYEFHPVVDERRMEELCNYYIAKLKATKYRLAELRYTATVEEQKTIDDREARQEFESEAVVPVTLPREYEKSTLMCEYKDIGLSRNCPSEEYTYWDSQHKEIRKHFNRFIRQPQRSVEKAVDTDFRRAGEVDVKKARRLTKFQLQDVKIKMYEEEQNMLETTTEAIFNKAEYDRKLDEADRDLKRGIEQRMTKSKSVIAPIIPAVLFMLGFIPLFLSEFNSFGSVSMSVILTSLALGSVLICSGIMLFVFRKRIIDLFKHFNYVMSGIYNNVMVSMQTFAKYLGHAADVMRGFAAVNSYEEKTNDMLNIYRKHEIDIDHCMGEIVTMFADYVDEYYTPSQEVEPYKYDFDKPNTYTYEMPYRSASSQIEFLQTGNVISVPIDYIKSIELRREELYD